MYKRQVVNVVSVGDFFPVVVFPDFLVKSSPATAALAAVRDVVGSVCASGRVGVSAVSDPVEDDCFDSWHVVSISP